MVCTSVCLTWTHNSIDRKGGLVDDGVEVGRVGVMLGVLLIVGDGVCVAVEASVRVTVSEGDGATEGVCVTVGVSIGGFGRGIRIKANRRMIPIIAGIPNLRSADGNFR